jgi:putative aminopeptidase FrvX
MASQLLEHMRELCAIPGPPGREDAVRDRIVEILRPSADILRADAFGNLIARHSAVDTVPHVLIECHMDEVGLVVRQVEPGGAVRFDKVGLVADAALPGQEINLLTEDGKLHRGVINIRAGHLQARDGQEHPGAQDMWIDLGVLDGAAARGIGIGPGTQGVFHSPFEALSEGVWKSKAVDNRAGCALCIEAFLNMKALANRLRLSAAFCVQEEVGGRGASVLSTSRTIGRHSPDLAIVIDTVGAEGPAGVNDALGVRLGGGPVLRRYDFSPGSRLGHIPSREMVAWVRSVARSAGVAMQEDAYVGTFTDAATLSRSLPGGLPVVTLNLPRRNAHSSSEMFMESDLNATAALIGALLRTTAEGDYPKKGKDYKE